LRFWALEGSRDGSEWIELDRREKNTELNNQGAIATFPVSHSDEVHMIRLRSNDHLHVSAIEVFGVLVNQNNKVM
jgi:hypothetical protein